MQTEHTTLIEGFKTNGLYRLKYPEDLRVSVLKALESWKKFVALPNLVTDQFPYDKGVGYEHQKGTGPTDDRKQDFHFTFDGASLLSGMVDGCSNESLRDVSRGLIDAAGRLVEHLTPSVTSFAQDVETHFGLDGFKDEVLASKGTWFVRFLYYPGGRNVGEATAVPHIDKSAFTFHLFESAPGLQGLDYDSKKWFDTPVSDTETVIFPGYQLQYVSGGKINALCHRVAANDYRTEVARVKAENPDILLVIHFGSSLGNAVKQAREVGVTSVIMGDYESEDPTVLNLAGKAAEGMIISSSQPEVLSADVLDFQKRYEAKFGQTPDVLATNAYDAVIIQAKAYAVCNGDSVCMAKEIASTKNFPGVSGQITINPKDHSVSKPTIFKIVKNGKFVEVK